MRLVKLKRVVLSGIALQLYFFSLNIGYAQHTPADTAFLQSAVQNTLAAYHEAVGVQTHLYNGTEYVDYKKSYVKGDQFLSSRAVKPGSIFYDGTWYTEVPMLYDLITDEVIVPHNSSGLMMQLIKEKIDTFQVHGHTFVHFNADSTGQIPLQPGFYDVMHSQNVQFLIKRSKNIQEKATADGMEGDVREANKFYIRKDGTYHQVSSKRSVLKVLKDRKKQLQKYASAQKLRFRKRREEAIMALVRYYDSLPVEQVQQNDN